MNDVQTHSAALTTAVVAESSKPDMGIAFLALVPVLALPFPV